MHECSDERCYTHAHAHPKHAMHSHHDHMCIAARYSFKNALKLLKKEKPAELLEVMEAIENVKVKKAGLYSPKELSKAILDSLYACGWKQPKAAFDMPGNPIEGDAVKNGVGVELQFGKYSFLGWDTLRKMAAFAEKGTYKYGIEIAPMASLRRRMSKGVGSFEQVEEKMEKEKPKLKIPVLVLGIEG